jgi:hypothetical protein
LAETTVFRIPIKELVEVLVALQVRVEQLIQVDFVRFDKRRDGFDRISAVKDLPFLQSW